MFKDGFSITLLKNTAIISPVICIKKQIMYYVTVLLSYAGLIWLIWVIVKRVCWIDIEMFYS